MASPSGAFSARLSPLSCCPQTNIQERPLQDSYSGPLSSWEQGIGLRELSVALLSCCIHTCSGLPQFSKLFLEGLSCLLLFCHLQQNLDNRIPGNIPGFFLLTSSPCLPEGINADSQGISSAYLAQPLKLLSVVVIIIIIAFSKMEEN